MKKILAFLFAVSLFYFVGAQSVLASSLFNVEVRTYLDGSNMNQAASGLSNQARGSKVQFNASGISPEYTFAFYAVNDIVRDDLPQNYEFVVRSNMKITAFFRPNGSVTPANARHVVIFADNNGKIIADGVQYVADGGTATEPSVLPTKPNATHATPKWFTPQGESSLENITSSRVYLLQYVSTDNTEYTVNVTGGSVVEDAPFNYNDVVTLVPNAAPAEQVFSHWEDAEGNVLSTKANYKFTVMGNVSVQAVFAASPEFSGPVVNMSDALSIRSGFVTYKGQFDLPANYTLVEYGFIFSRSSDVLTLDSLGATVVPSNVHNGQTGEFLRSFPNDTFNSVRAYLIVKNAAQEEVIVYSENYYRNPAELGSETDSTYKPNVQNTGYAPKSVNYLDQNSTNSKTFTLNGTSIASSTGKGVTGNTFIMNPAHANASPSDKAWIQFSAPGATLISFDIAPWATTETDKLDLVELQVFVNDSWTTITDLKPIIPGTVGTVYNHSVNVTGESFRIYAESDKAADSRLVIDNIRVVVSAPYTGPIHEVSFDVDGVITTEFVADGASFIKANPTKVGYTFSGWFTNDLVPIQYSNVSAINHSISLNATFTINQYTITFNVDGGTPVASITQDYDTDVIQPSAPTKEGYTFAGWFSDANKTTPYTFSKMTSNNTVYAKWQVNQYDIDFVTGDPSVTVSPITADYLSNVNAPSTPTRDGYTFAGWYYENSFETPVVFPIFMPLNGDTLYAKWNEIVGNVYTISFITNGGSEVSSVQVNEGDTLTQPSPNPTKTGFYFLGWTDSELNNYVFSSPVSESFTLYAKWAQVYTVLIDNPTTTTNSTAFLNNASLNSVLSFTNSGLASFTVTYLRNSAGTHSLLGNTSGEVRLYPGNTNGGQINYSISSGYSIVGISVSTGGTNQILSINGEITSTLTNSVVTRSFNQVSSVYLKNVANVSSGTRVDIKDLTISYIVNPS